MKVIDRPFRFTLDFSGVWLLIWVSVFCLTRGQDVGPWYSDVAIVTVGSLFMTFLLYGPVLVVRQVVRSGSRGRFVGRVLLSILLVTALAFGGLLLFGIYTESIERVLAFGSTAIATFYLNWRLEKHRGQFSRGN